MREKIIASIQVEIYKHNYQLIDDLPEYEWDLVAPDMDSFQREVLLKTMRNFSQSNAILESEDKNII